MNSKTNSHQSIYEQISSNIQHSLSIQQQILLQLKSPQESKASSSGNHEFLLQQLSNFRDSTLQFRQQIASQWIPFHSNLISIIDRVVRLYQSKIESLQQQLSQQRCLSSQRQKQITVLKGLLAGSQGNENCGHANGNVQNKCIKTFSQREVEEKVKISDYISLNHSLAKENTQPSSRAAELQTFEIINFHPLESLELSKLNQSLQLSRQRGNSCGFSSNQLKAASLLADTIKKSGSKTFSKAKKEKQNTRDRSLSKTIFDISDCGPQGGVSLSKVELESQGGRMDQLRRSLFNRRKSQRFI